MASGEHLRGSRLPVELNWSCSSGEGDVDGEEKASPDFLIDGDGIKNHLEYEHLLIRCVLIRINSSMGINSNLT